jgi:hypothetical protein
VVADVTAANGFHMELNPGTAGISYAADYLNWSCNQPVTAYLVPEPASVSVLGVGALALAFLRRRQV